jgi:hypothetical protein
LLKGTVAVSLVLSPKKKNKQQRVKNVEMDIFITDNTITNKIMA